MFSKTITNSSQFLMMPPSAQNLYFHFGMNADDDGFCEYFGIMRMTDSKPDDLRVLEARQFVKIFDDKVLVILQWKDNNYIQADRYTPSKYLKIFKNDLKLLANINGKPCIQNVSKMDTQVRLGKVRLGNIYIDHFERFWKAYPKKVGRKPAQKKFSTLKEEVMPKIFEELEKQKLSKQWREGFIPNPLTWLNQERWNDETPPLTREQEARALVEQCRPQFGDNAEEAAMFKFSAKYGNEEMLKYKGIFKL